MRKFIRQAIEVSEPLRRLFGMLPDDSRWPVAFLLVAICIQAMFDRE